MTLKEAIKILKKEGFHMILEKKVIYQNGAIREFEKPEVCEAIKVANENRLTVGLTPTEWNEREARLKNEHEENTKDPDSVGELPKEDSVVNPALAESASQFNDALLDEQADKIKRLGKEITRLNKAIHKKNIKIEELRKESSRHLRGKIKVFYENVDLEKMLKDKNAVLSDVAEELRLTKIREKNLAELGLKYVGENEKLKKELADKVVDEIDARALKSAESAIAYKEKVIAEKDDVIADLGKELKEKHKKYVWYKGLYEAAKQILNTIADYASKHPDKKFSDQMVGVDIADEGADLTGVIVIKSEK